MSSMIKEVLNYLEREDFRDLKYLIDSRFLHLYEYDETVRICVCNDEYEAEVEGKDIVFRETGYVYDFRDRGGRLHKTFCTYDWESKTETCVIDFDLVDSLKYLQDISYRIYKKFHDRS